MTCARSPGTEVHVESELELQVRQALAVCYDFASKHSDDTSNQNAAMIVGYSPRTGFVLRSIQANRIPEGVTKTEERIKQRPTKYAFMEHAERSVIYDCAKHGICTQGLTMICPWFACADCARAIVLAGITRVIGHKQRMEMTNLGREKVADTVQQRWTAEVSHGDQILQDAGIELVYFDGTIDGINILINEQRVTKI
jgi:dCMP deaminase